MIVAGGVYREICHFPDWKQYWGSGLRAAVAAKSFTEDVTLHTYLPDCINKQIKGQGASFGVKVKSYSSPEVIEFKYYHPLADPRISPSRHKIVTSSPITVKSENVLVFGFMEGEAKVEAQKAVFDPQSPDSPSLFSDSGSKAESLAIVINSTECRALTKEQDIHQGIKTLAAAEGAVVVVVKNGPFGCLVWHDGTTTHLPAFRTDSVFSIGSGDVFAGAFAAQWMELNRHPVDAARIASKSAASYCSNRTLPIPKEIDSSAKLQPLELSEPKDKRQIYLASPFFDIGQLWMVEESLDALAGGSLNVFSPYHEVGVGPAKEIYEKDIKALEESRIVFAILEGMDPGTVFEIGYAVARNIPVVVYLKNRAGLELKMLEGSGCQIFDDFASAVYHTVWLALK